MAHRELFNYRDEGFRQQIVTDSSRLFPVHIKSAANIRSGATRYYLHYDGSMVDTRLTVNGDRGRGAGGAHDVGGGAAVVAGVLGT